jgi:hypothetical protein
MTLNGHDWMSFFTVSSSNRRPINRLQWSAFGDCRGDVGCARNSLDVEDSVLGVHGGLVLRRLADQTLLAGEGDERRGCEATLLVGDCKEKLLDSGISKAQGSLVLISTLVPS